MMVLLSYVQWFLALTIVMLIGAKYSQIRRLDMGSPMAHDDVLFMQRQLARGLYPLRILPSVAMTLGMLIAMLDLAHALGLQGNPRSSAVMVTQQRENLQHAFHAMGWGVGSAAVGLFSWAWLRREAQRKLHAVQRHGVKEHASV
jgi:hypothetical protein